MGRLRKRSEIFPRGEFCTGKDKMGFNFDRKVFQVSTPRRTMRENWMTRKKSKRERDCQQTELVKGGRKESRRASRFHNYNMSFSAYLFLPFFPFPFPIIPDFSITRQTCHERDKENTTLLLFFQYDDYNVVYRFGHFVIFVSGPKALHSPKKNIPICFFK